MDAIIGRYKVHLEEGGLVLTHPSKISFDLTAEEVLSLLDFIKVYQQTLTMMQRDTDAELQRIVIKKESLQEE